MEQGKLDAAVAAYQAMMDQKPSPQAYSRAAHLRWLRGDLPGAIELMSWAAGASNPHDPESAAWTRVHLARYKWQAGDTARALELINCALLPILLLRLPQSYAFTFFDANRPAMRYDPSRSP